MSGSERERFHVMRALSKGLLLQRGAAERLSLGVRQVKRFFRAWRGNGDAGLISRQRGRRSRVFRANAEVASLLAHGLRLLELGR